VKLGDVRDLRNLRVNVAGLSRIGDNEDVRLDGHRAAPQVVLGHVVQWGVLESAAIIQHSPEKAVLSVAARFKHVLN
jgi:hypothetical protein